MTLAAVHAAIPHREPILLIDEIVEQSAERIHCRRTFRADEWYFAGHYPGDPIVPGVLLCEAAMQAGAVLMSATMEVAAPGKVPVATRMNDVRFKRIIRPGDTIDIEVELKDKLADAYYFNAKVTCEGKLAVRFEFAGMLAGHAAEAR